MPVRDQRIDIRFSETEKLAINRQARRDGYKTASALIRNVVARHLAHGFADGENHRRLIGMELLLARLNAKLQRIILLSSGEPMSGEFPALVADIRVIAAELKHRLHQLSDLPRGRRGRGDGMD